MTTPQPDNYMRAAAEKAINDLQQQVTYAMDAAERAEDSAARAETLAKRWKKLTIMATALVVLVGALGSWMFLGLRHQAINTCNNGNDRAAGIVTAIDELVLLLEGPHPTADTKKKAAAYDAYVAAHNQQRDCSRAYSILP